jgi:hypothetical protein
MELSELRGEYRAEAFGDHHLENLCHLVLYGTSSEEHLFKYHYRYTTNHGIYEEFWEGHYRFPDLPDSIKEKHIVLVGEKYKWGWEDYFNETFFEEGPGSHSLGVCREEHGRYSLEVFMEGTLFGLRWAGDDVERALAEFERSVRPDIERYRKSGEMSTG